MNVNQGETRRLVGVLPTVLLPRASLELAIYHLQTDSERDLNNGAVLTALVDRLNVLSQRFPECVVH